MKIAYFAQLKDATGCAEEELAVSQALDGEGLWRLLLSRHPGLDRFRTVTRLARNLEYAGPETRFSEGDEVALIPPVSGG